MALQSEEYIRKSFPVEAIQVTAENMKELADWCGGVVREDNSDSNPTDHKFYIKVRVHNPMSERQTKAYVGDWLLYAGKGYKIYNNHAFEKSFVKSNSDQPTLDFPAIVNNNVFSAPTDSGPETSGSVSNPGGTTVVK